MLGLPFIRDLEISFNFGGFIMLSKSRTLVNRFTGRKSSKGLLGIFFKCELELK